MKGQEYFPNPLDFISHFQQKKKPIQRHSLFFFFFFSYEISIQLDLNCRSCSISANLISCQSSSAISSFFVLLWFVRVALLSLPAAHLLCRWFFLDSPEGNTALLLQTGSAVPGGCITARSFPNMHRTSSASSGLRMQLKFLPLVVDVDVAVEADVRLKAATNTQAA